MSEVASVLSEQVNNLLAQGAVALDIRDIEEREAVHMVGSLNVSRGVLSANTLRQMGYANAKSFVSCAMGRVS